MSERTPEEWASMAEAAVAVGKTHGKPSGVATLFAEATAQAEAKGRRQALEDALSAILESEGNVDFAEHKIGILIAAEVTP